MWQVGVGDKEDQPMRGFFKFTASSVLVLATAAALANNSYRTNYPLPTVGKSFSGASVTLKTWQASDAEFQKIAAAGFKYVRLNIWWKYIEPVKGSYVFTSYDNYAAWAGKYGLRLNLIFDHSNALYGSDIPTITQPFANYAAACTTHFAGQGVLWEMINEPDVAGLAVADYMTLEHAAAGAVRAVTPDEYLLGPSVSSIVLPSAQAYLQGCLDAGILNDVDAVTVHPYIHDTPETITVPFSRTRALINSYPGGSTKPLFASEWGYPSSELPIYLTPKPYTNALPNILVDSNNFASNTSWRGWYVKPNVITGIADPVGGNNATRMLTADWSGNVSLGYSGIGQFGSLVRGDYYVASVWLRSTGTVQTMTIGLNDHDKISFTIGPAWARYSFSFIDVDPWSQGRALQITEATQNNPAWDIYGAQLEHVGQLTPAIVDTAQRNLQGQFLIRAYRACLANQVPYFSLYEWIENPAAPGCGMNKVDGTPYPAYTTWVNYYHAIVK